jgi:hypothetical protein
MSDQLAVEERLTEMERAVRDLQERLAAMSGKTNWLHRLYGAFDGVPESEFQDFVRLGREFRHADRPSDENEHQS